MKSLNLNLRRLLFFVFLFSGFAISSEKIMPEIAVQNFYQAYLSEESINEGLLTNKYVSNELMKSINDSLSCNYDSDNAASSTEIEEKCSQKHECKQEKNNYICNWYGVWVESDVNYFTKSQDIYPSWEKNIQTHLISKKDNQATVRVTLGESADLIMRLQVTLKEENKVWKIIRVTE